MQKLRTEYTDLKKLRHTVTHCTLYTGDPAFREQILAEIQKILTDQRKKISGTSG